MHHLDFNSLAILLLQILKQKERKHAKREEKRKIKPVLTGGPGGP